MITTDLFLTTQNDQPPKDERPFSPRSSTCKSSHVPHGPAAPGILYRILFPQPPWFTLSLSLKGSPQFHGPNDMTEFTMTQTAVGVWKTALLLPGGAKYSTTVAQLWHAWNTNTLRTGCDSSDPKSIRTLQGTQTKTEGTICLWRLKKPKC